MKKITVQNIKTWGLVQEKRYGGYKLPVSFKEDQATIEKVNKIADKQEARSPFYGDSRVIYFKIYELTRKQKEDLLDQGEQKIDLSFTIEDKPLRVESKNISYLRLRVVGLKISETDNPDAPSDEI